MKKTPPYCLCPQLPDWQGKETADGAAAAPSPVSPPLPQRGYWRYWGQWRGACCVLAPPVIASSGEICCHSSPVAENSSTLQVPIPLKKECRVSCASHGVFSFFLCCCCSRDLCPSSLWMTPSSACCSLSACCPSTHACVSSSVCSYGKGRGFWSSQWNLQSWNTPRSRTWRKLSLVVWHCEKRNMQIHAFFRGCFTENSALNFFLIVQNKKGGSHFRAFEAESLKWREQCFHNATMPQVSPHIHTLKV